MSIHAELLIDRIGRLYELATDDLPGDSFVSNVFKAMDVESGIMFVTDFPTGAMQRFVGASANMDGSARARYQAHFHSINPWYQRALERVPPYVARGEELVDEARFENSEFYNDWCRHIGIRHMIGGVMPLDKGLVVATGIHRGRRQGPFDDQQTERYGILLRHVARALLIHEKLKEAKATANLSLDLLARLGNGLIVLDDARKPVVMNRVAETLCRNGDWFVAPQGRLAPVLAADHAGFDRAIARAFAVSAGTSAVPGSTITIHDPVRGPLRLMVAPFRSPLLGYGSGRPAAMILFADPVRSVVAHAEPVGGILGLTPAETRVLFAVSQGSGLAGVAAELGVSINTVRTHLRAVFAKTGTSRQAELTALVAQDPVLRLSALGRQTP